MSQIAIARSLDTKIKLQTSLNMPRYSSSSSSSGIIGGFLAMLIGGGSLLFIYFGVWAGLAALLAIWTSRNLDFWASYVQHHAVHVPFVIAWVASLPLPLTFIADIIAEIAKFFV